MPRVAPTPDLIAAVYPASVLNESKLPQTLAIHTYKHHEVSTPNRTIVLTMQEAEQSLAELVRRMRDGRGYVVVKHSKGPLAYLTLAVRPEDCEEAGSNSVTGREEYVDIEEINHGNVFRSSSEISSLVTMRWPSRPLNAYYAHAA